MQNQNTEWSGEPFPVGTRAYLSDAVMMKKVIGLLLTMLGGSATFTADEMEQLDQNNSFQVLTEHDKVTGMVTFKVIAPRKVAGIQEPTSSGTRPRMAYLLSRSTIVAAPGLEAYDFRPPVKWIGATWRRGVLETLTVNIDNGPDREADTWNYPAEDLDKTELAMVETIPGLYRGGGVIPFSGTIIAVVTPGGSVPVSASGTLADGTPVNAGGPTVRGGIVMDPSAGGRKIPPMFKF